MTDNKEPEREATKEEADDVFKDVDMVALYGDGPGPNQAYGATKLQLEEIARKIRKEVVEEYREFVPDHVKYRKEQNRKRAARANIFRKLDNAFPLYAGFTAARAAEKCGVRFELMLAYLEVESATPGTRIEKDEEGKFFINNPFL